MLLIPMIISGFAMGFVFVPLTTLTMGTLSNTEIGNASGIYNLMRNTGGSLGIAAMTTFLARGAQVHQAALMPNMNEYNPAFQKTFEQIKNSLLANTDAVTASQQAYQAIYGMVVGRRQFYLILIIFDCSRFFVSSPFRPRFSSKK